MGRSRRWVSLAVAGLLVAGCSGWGGSEEGLPRLVNLNGPSLSAAPDGWGGTVHYSSLIVGYEGEGPIRILDVVPRFATIEVPVGEPFAFTPERPIASTDLWATLEEIEKDFPGWRAAFRSLDELEDRPLPSRQHGPEGVALGVPLDLSGGLSEDLFIPAVEVHYHDGRRDRVLVLHNGLVICPEGPRARRCGHKEADTFFDDLPDGI